MRKLKVVELLLNHPVAQANIDYNSFSVEKNPKTAFHMACYHGFPEMVKFFVDNAEKYGIDVFTTDGYGRSPIEIAKHCQHDHLLEILPLGLNDDV